MAYNNGFPMNYPQFYPQFPQGQQSQQILQNPQPQQQGNLIWVQGETGAKSYLLAPNTTLPLWDSERQTIYLKSADASGMPSMKTLDYTIREQQQPQNVIESPKSDYVTHDELKLLEDRIKDEIKGFKEEMGA